MLNILNAREEIREVSVPRFQLLVHRLADLRATKAPGEKPKRQRVLVGFKS